MNKKLNEKITINDVEYIINFTSNIEIGDKFVSELFSDDVPSKILTYTKSDYKLGYDPNSLTEFGYFKVTKVKTLPKLLIIGNARHGKDTLAELLNEMYGLTFISSSQAAADIFIYDTLKDEFGYSNPVECFEDRVNHRALWYDLICGYNENEKTRLAKEILKKSDCYVGMRDGAEIDQCNEENLFDLIIWVDASKRLEKESADSFNIDESYADVILDNNGTYEQFKEKVRRFGKILING